jgi:hypothetical protein
VRFERPHDLNSHRGVGTEKAQGAWRKAQGKTINARRRSALHLVPWTLYHLLGLPGEDYEAKGAVQTALDELDCGLEEHPPGAPAALSYSLFL